MRSVCSWRDPEFSREDLDGSLLSLWQVRPFCCWTRRWRRNCSAFLEYQWGHRRRLRGWPRERKCPTFCSRLTRTRSNALCLQGASIKRRKVSLSWNLYSDFPYLEDFKTTSTHSQHVIRSDRVESRLYQGIRVWSRRCYDEFILGSLLRLIASCAKLFDSPDGSTEFSARCTLKIWLMDDSTDCWFSKWNSY